MQVDILQLFSQWAISTGEKGPKNFWGFFFYFHLKLWKVLTQAQLPAKNFSKTSRSKKKKISPSLKVTLQWFDTPGATLLSLNQVHQRLWLESSPADGGCGFSPAKHIETQAHTHRLRYRTERLIKGERWPPGQQLRRSGGKICPDAPLFCNHTVNQGCP